MGIEFIEGFISATILSLIAIIFAFRDLAREHKEEMKKEKDKLQRIITYRGRENHTLLYEINKVKEENKKIEKLSENIIKHLNSHACHMYDISCENDVKEIEELIKEIKGGIK